MPSAANQTYKQMPIRLLGAVVVAVICLYCQPAIAQDDSARVDAYYKQGMDNFYRDEYSLAIANFKRAYAIEPHAIFQYNIAVAASRLGNLREARKAAKEALRLGGMPEDIMLKARSRLHGFETALGAQRVAEAMSAAEEQHNDSASGLEAKQAAKQKAAGEHGHAGADGGGVAAREPTGASLSGVGWTGVAVGSLGVAGLVSAGFFDMSLAADIDRYDQARIGGDDAKARRLSDQINSDQQLGRWMVYGSGAAMALGAALLAVDWSMSEDTGTSSQVRVGASSTGGSVELQWDF